MISQFCFRSISNEFDSNDLNEVPIRGNVHDFSGNYDAIDKSNLLNISN